MVPQFSPPPGCRYRLHHVTRMDEEFHPEFRASDQGARGRGCWLVCVECVRGLLVGLWTCLCDHTNRRAHGLHLVRAVLRTPVQLLLHTPTPSTRDDASLFD